MTFKNIIQKRMFILLAALQLFFTLWGGIEHVSINRTVGWLWDITNFVVWLKVGAWLLFVFGYGILAIAGYKTSFYLSLLHLLVIIAIFFLQAIFFVGPVGLFFAYMFSVIVFVLNLIWAIRYRNF